MRKSREVLLALKALVAEALPGADIKGFDRDLAQVTQPGPGGTVIGYPGDPGEPEADLSPLTYFYEHRFPMEVLPPLGADDPAHEIDVMLVALGAAAKADRSLGGACEYLEVEAAEESGDAALGAGELRSAGFAFIAHYSTTDPLGG
jgi:hypothetical protein